MPESRITIVGVGRHLTHFKHCKTQEQKRVTTQVETISHLQEYLKAHRGKLIEPKPVRKSRGALRSRRIPR